jgi:DNA invertase Pin-like site-specific DNA recombinase
MPRAFSYTRLSSGHQTRGDGGRRQVDRAEAFAKAQGLILDRTFDLNDHGLSGYDGSNVERGQLGKFIEAVRGGRIEKGSVLIVESLDRLSRASARQSLRQFLELLDAGIVITTLIDGRTYTEESDHADLMVSLGVMQRAYDESRTKSDRGRAAWENKRKNMSTKILTKCCPGWLKPKPDRSGFDVVKSRVDVVKRMFADTTTKGMGVSSIMRRLNKEKVPTFGKGKAWHGGYIHRILRSRAVLGEFAPASNGQSAEAIPNYYPRIIADDVFYRATANLEKRRQAGGGRRGAIISNLFTKIAACGVCGHRMAMKGGKRGVKVLACNGYERGLGCSSVSWRYDQFEASFLSFVEEIDLASLSGATADQAEWHSLEAAMRETEGRLLAAERRRNQTYDLILGDEPTDFLRSKLRDLDGEVAAMQKQMMTLREKLNSLSQEANSFSRGKAEIGEMIQRIQSGADDTYGIRSTLAARLRDLVSKAFVWPNPVRITIGDGGKVETVHADRCFSVFFRNGTNRLIAPTGDDPARVVNTPSGMMVGAYPSVREQAVQMYKADPTITMDTFVMIETAN